MSKQISSTGVVASPASLNKILEKVDSPLKESYRIYQAEVGNATGNAAVCSWGIGLEAGAVRIGNYASSTFTDQTDILLVNGSVSLSGATGIVIASPLPLNAIQLDIDTADQASTFKFWNGTAFAAYSEGTTGAIDTSSTGVQLGYNHLLPSTEVKVGTNSAGLPEGYYCYLMDNPGTLVIDSVLVVSFQDYVKTVADGNSMISIYEDGIDLPHGDIYSYISATNGANWSKFDYKKGC